MSLIVEIGDDFATLACEPEYGRRVVFDVRYRNYRVGRSHYTTPRFVVGLRGSNEAGFSGHTKFEAAVKAATIRARRYHDAYSVPRGVAA
jgi:hypothetical protein